MTAAIVASSDSRRSLLVREAGHSAAGTVLTYERLAALLGIEDDPDAVAKIQAAKSDAWRELGEVYGRALRVIPNVGYEVVAGQEMFHLVMMEVGYMLRSVRRIARRFLHVESELLTQSQVATRTSIVKRLVLSWSDIRKDYKAGFQRDLEVDLDDEGQLN
jgi:hypothetical protein